MAVRWVGILVVAPALPLLNLPFGRLVAAYGILLFAISYNVVIRWWMQRRPALFASGYATTVFDSLLNIAMVLVGGGFNSPFSYIIWRACGSSTIGRSMRSSFGRPR